MNKWTSLSPYLASEMYSDHQNRSKMASKEQPRMGRVGANEAVSRMDTRGETCGTLSGKPILATQFGSGSMHLPILPSETGHTMVELGPASVGWWRPHSGRSYWRQT